MSHLVTMIKFIFWALWSSHIIAQKISIELLVIDVGNLLKIREKLLWFRQHGHVISSTNHFDLIRRVSFNNWQLKIVVHYFVLFAHYIDSGHSSVILFCELRILSQIFITEDGKGSQQWQCQGQVLPHLHMPFNIMVKRLLQSSVKLLLNKLVFCRVKF